MAFMRGLLKKRGVNALVIKNELNIKNTLKLLRQEGFFVFNADIIPFQLNGEPDLR